MSARARQTVSCLALAASALTFTSSLWAQSDLTGKEHNELRAPSTAPASPAPVDAKTPKVEKTGGASATAKKSAASAKPAKKASGTKLKLRPNKPIALNEQPPSDGWWYKLLACAFIVAGAMWLYRRRTLLKPTAERHTMKILGRTSIGVRSELIIVNVDGQKLLLGVTPGSIQRIANLFDPTDEEVLASVDQERVLEEPAASFTREEADALPIIDQAPPANAREEIEPGFDYFIGKAQNRLATMRAAEKERPATKRAPRREGPRDDQARGLMDLISGRRSS